MFLQILIVARPNINQEINSQYRLIYSCDYKMKFLLLICLFVIVFMEIKADREKCEGQEIYSECMSSSCGNLKCGETDPEGCTPDCQRGCFCYGKNRRDSAGKCISKEQC